MKPFLLVCVVLFSSLGSLFGQWTLQASLVAPTGFNSYLLKPAPCIELGVKMGDADAFYQFGANLGYMSLKPTADTFRTYGLGYQFLPGYEVIHSYSIFSVGLTNDFNILKNKKLSPVLGFDIYLYAISIAEDNYVENLSRESTTGDSYWVVSISPRAGLRYRISDAFIISAGCARSIAIIGTANAIYFWKPFISLSYYPE